MVTASVIVMVPVLQGLSQHLVLTWLGVLALSAATVVLAHRRDKLRAAFFLPLAYIAALAAMRFRVERSIDSAAFSIALGAFVVLCLVGLVADAFWSPYADDLAEVEDLSQFREDA